MLEKTRRAVVRSHSDEALIKLIKLLVAAAGEDGRPKYYIPKALFLFFTLSAEHKRGLVEHICENIETGDRWRTDDPLEYMDLMRSVLFYYTGSQPKLAQPMVGDLALVVKDYRKSERYREAMKIKSSPKTDFMAELGAL